MRHQRQKKEEGREQDDSSPDPQKSRQEARHPPPEEDRCLRVRRCAFPNLLPPEKDVTLGLSSRINSGRSLTGTDV